jgi:hypothetical protein
MDTGGALFRLTGGSFRLPINFHRTVDATALNNELTVSGSNYVQVGENGVLITNINTINGEVFVYQCKCQR